MLPFFYSFWTRLLYRQVVISNSLRTISISRIFISLLYLIAVPNENIDTSCIIFGGMRTTRARPWALMTRSQIQSCTRVSTYGKKRIIRTNVQCTVRRIGQVEEEVSRAVRRQKGKRKRGERWRGKEAMAPWWLDRRHRYICAYCEPPRFTLIYD